MATEQALEKVAPSRTPGVLTTAEEYRIALAKWEGKYNVLTPFTNVSGIAPSFGIIASVVKINTDVAAGGEVYGGLLFLKGQKGTQSEELALAKIGLRKLAECGGISTNAVRTDPRTIPYYWEFHATASYRGLDGTMITRSATFEWDLRDGSDRLKGWQPNQVTEGRKNGLRNCEARAINAAIRECGCGIRQKYTRAELDKPFLVVRVAFQPDMQDPAIKEMVTRQALGGTSLLYPSPARELPAVDAEVIDNEPRQVGSGSTAPAAAPTPPAAPVAPTLPDGAVLIVKVEKTEHKRRDGGKFSKWTAIDSNGVAHVTTDRKVGEALERCAEKKTPVELTSEENEYQENKITELLPVGEPRQGSLPDPSTL
jgi:hypothetical protein